MYNPVLQLTVAFCIPINFELGFLQKSGNLDGMCDCQLSDTFLDLELSGI